MDGLVVDCSVLIPPEALDSLYYEQLLVIHHLYGSVISNKKTHRLQFMSPILISVCQLLPSVHFEVLMFVRTVDLSLCLSITAKSLHLASKNGRHGTRTSPKPVGVRRSCKSGEPDDINVCHRYKLH